MGAPFRFAELLARAEAMLVAELGLEPLALPEEMGRAEGTWKGQPVEIVTRAYRGAGVAYARFAALTGPALEIGNALCLPHPAVPLPIFGADLVALGRETALIAADLSPTLPPGPGRDAQIAPLEVARTGWPRLPAGGALPSWCANWFSPFPLFTRVTLAERDAAAAAFDTLPMTLAALARAARPEPALADVVGRTVSGYADAHRTVDKGLLLIEKMFGSRWAGRYLGEVLFPSLV